MTSPSKLARDRKRSAAHHRKIKREKTTPAVLRAGALEGYAAANALHCFKCGRTGVRFAMTGVIESSRRKWALCTSCADAHRRNKQSG